MIDFLMFVYLCANLTVPIIKKKKLLREFIGSLRTCENYWR